MSTKPTFFDLATERFAEEGCAIEIPALSTLSIDVLGWVHRASISAGDLFEGLGFATTHKEAANVLHGLCMSLVSLQNAIVGEMAEREAHGDAQRSVRARVLLDDAARCLEPGNEMRTALREFAETL